MNKVFLGIDTSNYRTSAAMIDADGSILAQKAVLLDVPEGKRGLRQSEAFFMHSNRLPDYIGELFGSVDPSDIKAVGVSERPRRIEGSYMPCFLAGVNASSAFTTLMECDWKVKTAIIMIKCKLSKDAANEALRKNCGVLRRTLSSLK
jgi:N6-L-threonylcarbamoyladenine synthase